ncbi:exopolysaccharide biosynthesis polyprenyl glycosylphosphotransferase [Tropicimonas sp. IMCC34043]|uniref:exopolysaccharide biosynthesis polyprenyl glycosylphosphotransferase n=1 Tax=Tropicimonas sp. IMCC34043 TaxID=2248760 RepID=UPI001E334B83|nr:exopolysaccharide biosynthesis polyprenyl glycosylphosphotransferase [Tropicimonas sp. IMCC34043]
MTQIQSITVGFPAADSEVSEAAARAARLLARPSLAPIRVAVLAAAAEALVLAIGYWFVLFGATPGPQFPIGPASMAAVTLALVSVAVVASLGGYGLQRLTKVRRGLGPLLAAIAVALLLAALHWQAASFGALARSAVLVAVLALVPFRVALSAAAAWAVASGLTARRAVLAGGGAEAERVVRGLADRPGNEIRICGIFDDRGAGRVPDAVLDVPKIGRFDDLVTFCRMAEIDLIILCLPPEADRRIAMLLEQFRVLPVPVHLSAFNPGFAFSDAQGRSLTEASFGAERRLAKRSFDLVAGGLLTLLLAPLMGVIAVMIRCDSPGPVFFRQERHGFNDHPIRVWKFRTMYADQCDPRALRVVTRGDPRVTRLGRLLRKSSLDELPQLFNVLEGTLSLVGPRPHAVDARSSRQERFTQIVSGYSARHRLPPGITGWAQIHGLRGEIDDPESLRRRFALDLYYIENWSLWLDLRILLLTPISLIDTRRAY